MVLHVVAHLAEVAEGREDLHADAHVLAHVRELLRREGAGLVQHLLAEAHLADVVNVPRDTQVLHRVGVEPHLLGDRCREVGHADGVAAQEDVQVVAVQRHIVCGSPRRSRLPRVTMHHHDIATSRLRATF